MSSLGRLPDTLPFTKADLRLPVAVRKSRRNSISGVQSKVLLSIVDGEFAVVESGVLLLPGVLSRKKQPLPEVIAAISA